MSRIRTHPPRILFCVLSAVLAGEALAIDGMIEASGSWQEGRSGPEAFSSTTERFRGFAGERIVFTPDLWMNFRYGALVENQENRTVASLTSYRKEHQDPFLSLLYEGRPFEAGIYGNARRTDYFFTGSSSTRDDFLSGTAFANWKGSWAEVEARYTQAHSRRQLDEGPTETRDRRLSLFSNLELGARDRLQYEYSRSLNDVLTSDFSSRLMTHRLDYNGNRDFADTRGRINLAARYKHLEQKVLFGGEPVARYLQPDWGGFALDDTPEFQDPLEPDPILVPALYDTDLDTPTAINIGDSAPVVREFGGDYRNIIFDFSDVVTIGSAILYVDTILRFPELMRWEVYVSDDPEGRDWGQPLGPDRVTWSYSQRANGRQGWVFQFNGPASHRRIKIVNSKLGATEDDIFITEFEVYGPVTDENPDQVSRNNRYRLNGSVSYALAEELDATYRGHFWWTAYGDSDREDRTVGHFGGMVWSPRNWRFGANASAGSRKTTTGRDTKIYTQRLSVEQRPRGNVTWRTSWNRSNDLSFDRDQVTNDLAGDVTWQALPALQFIQKFTYGRRDDHRLELESEAWSAITQVRTSPRRSLTLDLRRTNRWVSREAGAGFTPFNDTELRVTWAPLPRLVYSGMLRYQVRSESQWVRRSNLTLNPLPGGSMNMSLYASLNEDTRARTRQRALGARATWRPRPRLHAEGGIEFSRFSNRDTHSNPVNYYARGYWTF